MRGLRAELTSEKGQIDGGVLDPFTGKTGIQGIMMSEDMFDTYFVFGNKYGKFLIDIFIISVC